MEWNQITVQRFQDIHRLSLSTDLDEMTKLERVVCLVYDLTEDQVDDMAMKEFTEKSKSCAFLLNTDIPGKAVASFKVEGKRFAINYDPTKVKHRQYVELLHYGKNPIGNMHKILASIVQPVKWFRKRENKAEQHEEISSLMLQAPVTIVYHAAVFFCNLYSNLINALTPSLIAEMTEEGKMTEEEAREAIADSRNIMDGSILQKK